MICKVIHSKEVDYYTGRDEQVENGRFDNADRYLAFENIVDDLEFIKLNFFDATLCLEDESEPYVVIDRHFGYL
jgi:hypothetical protein